MENNNNTTICPSCNGENEEKARFCVHCGNPFPRKRKFTVRNRYVLFGTIALILSGAIISFSTGGLEFNRCEGGSRVQPLDPKIEADAKAKGLEYYEKKTQKKGASARVTDFGCHIQVDIIDGGKVVLSLTYRQGEVQEI